MIEVPIPGCKCRIVSELPERPDLREVPGSVVRFAENLLELPLEEVGTYRIEDGNRISILPQPGVDPELLLFYLKATPFGLLILQHGDLPLHASAVVPPGGSKALLVAGTAGAGKSTTAALLVQRGWQLLNDDLSRITFESEVPLVWPGYTSLKLGEESLQLLGLVDAGLPRTPGVREKSYWHVEGHRFPLPVAAMAILGAPDAPPASPRRLGGLELLEHLYLQTFRPYLVQPLGYHRQHFAQIGRFAAKVPCHLVDGNQKLSQDALAALLEGLAVVP